MRYSWSYEKANAAIWFIVHFNWHVTSVQQKKSLKKMHWGIETCRRFFRSLSIRYNVHLLVICCIYMQNARYTEFQDELSLLCRSVCSVRKASRLRLYDRGAMVQFPADARQFSLLRSLHLRSGAHPASQLVNTGCSFGTIAAWSRNVTSICSRG
jgi:hypothetical protein